MESEKTKYAALFLMLACYLAHADDSVKTVGDLDHLQSGRVFYDAQAAFNKARRAAIQPDVISESAITASASSVTAPTISTEIPVPVLEKVAGSVATLQLNDHSITQVRPGDKVSGGFTVVSVSMRGVILKRTQDGRLMTLN